MKWGIYSLAGILCVSFLVPARHLHAAGDIDAVDSNGRVFDTYLVSQDIYVSGSCTTAADEYVEVYVVDDRNNWQDGTELADRSDSVETVKVDEEGEVTLTRIWSSKLDTGEYDVVLDLNGNKKYDEYEDCVDSEKSEGFKVINKGAGDARPGSKSPDEDFDWSVRVGDPFVVLLQVRLDVEDLEDLLLTSIELDATGSGDDEDTLLDVIIAKDKNNDGKYVDGGDLILGNGQYDRDNDELIIELDYVLEADETENILVVYLMGKGLRDDKTYAVTVKKIEAEGVLSGDDLLFDGLPIESFVMEVGGSGDAQEVEQAGVEAEPSTVTTPQKSSPNTGNMPKIENSGESLLSGIFGTNNTDDGVGGRPWIAPLGVRVALFILLGFVLLIALWRIITTVIALFLNR